MKGSPFIVGEKIYLRALERTDLEGEYLQWLNDHEVTRFMESGRTPTTADALAEYYSRVAGNANGVMMAIVELETDRHVGNTKLGPINWVHRYAEFGIMIGAKDSWGRGYGTEATRLMLDYGFCQLNLNKILLGVVGDHAAAISAYEKVGFRHEGRITRLLYVEGYYRDKVIMGVTREEFRGLPDNTLLGT